MDLAASLAMYVGFEYRIKLVDDGKYGAKIDDGNRTYWNGMIGEIIDGVGVLLFSPEKLFYQRNII